MTVDVEASKPFWLVLGQSYSDGWTATGLGAPTLVDGYANGWYVTPTGAGSTRISLRFTPQRTVTAALVVSLLSALLCLALAFASRHGQRRGEPPPPPRWVWPWQPEGTRPRVAVLMAIALAGGISAGLLVDPVAGAGIAAALIVGVATARGPGVLAVGSIASLGLAALFTLAKQWRNHYPPDFGWPGFFAPAHHLAWIGLLLIAASVAAGAARRRAAAPAREPR